MSEPRVVITGMGWITPLGHDLDTVWSALTSGTSGIAPIDRFDASCFPTTFAGEVRDYDWTAFVNDASVHHSPALNSQFVLGAARQAWEQSGLGDFGGLDRNRTGLYLGAGEGVLDFDAHSWIDTNAWTWDDAEVDPVQWAKYARERLDEWGEVEQEPNMSLWHVAREYGLRGPAFNCLTACAASTQAIGEACSVLRRGQADVMLGGGAHTMVGLRHYPVLSSTNQATVQIRAEDGGVVAAAGAPLGAITIQYVNLIVQTLEDDVFGVAPQQTFASSAGGRPASHYSQAAQLLKC